MININSGLLGIIINWKWKEVNIIHYVSEAFSIMIILVIVEISIRFNVQKAWNFSIIKE